MEIIRVKNAYEGGKKAFELLQEEMVRGIHTVGLATGATPEELYKQMVASSVDFTNITSINLDEYIGLDGRNPRSYRYFMNAHLFSEKPFQATFVPNGKAENLEEECHRYEEILANHPIDFQILGIGRNGHIGFNEPGTPFDKPTHIVDLTPSTIESNKRYFEDIKEVPTKAISMGIGSIIKGKKLVLMAFGESKAEAIQGMIEGPLSIDLPASVLQTHPNVTVIIDEAAGSKLTEKN